jgi:hypothetical protein
LRLFDTTRVSFVQLVVVVIVTLMTPALDAPNIIVQTNARAPTDLTIAIGD